MTEIEILAALRAARKANLWLMLSASGPTETPLLTAVLDTEDALFGLLSVLGDDTNMSSDGTPGTPGFTRRRAIA